MMRSFSGKLEIRHRRFEIRPFLLEKSTHGVRHVGPDGALPQLYRQRGHGRRVCQQVRTSTHESLDKVMDN